ncbi:MAG TPA: hypothetical protein VFU32_10245, partial [Ktedonobacterales bacterium]|nr:hypothetical protein [Ktedonobacterales bacterium]
MSLAQRPQRDQFEQSQPDKQSKKQRKRDSAGWKGALTSERHEARAAVKTLRGFWKKASNDWIFNLSAMLAYNLLMTIVPILAMLLSIFGLVLGSLSPATEQQFINSI